VGGDATRHERFPTRRDSLRVRQQSRHWRQCGVNARANILGTKAGVPRERPRANQTGRRAELLSDTNWDTPSTCSPQQLYSARGGSLPASMAEPSGARLVFAQRIQSIEKVYLGQAQPMTKSRLSGQSGPCSISRLGPFPGWSCPSCRGKSPARSLRFEHSRPSNLV
jgi:hypothetical protein